MCADPNAGPGDIVRDKGHMDGLIARPGGVLVRAGHTEGSVDPLEFVMQRDVTAPIGEWTRFTLTIGAQAGMGRLGFIHTGPQATANYVALDTLRIDTLPPST